MFKRTLLNLTALAWVFMYSPAMAATDGLTSTPLATMSQDASKSVTLSSYRGKVLLVDFWASWCIPCRQSFPFYQSLQDKYGSQGFMVIGINGEDDKDAALKFYNDYGVNFLILRDEGNVLSKKINMPKMPTSYLIDRSGKVVYEHDGFFPGDDAVIEQKVKALLGK
jgi:cytochrome c biogenesis protein CcmG, thiol:disulfide interchange protein DsbE